MNPEIGSTISHYRLLEQIGQGGMGVVYKAEDTRHKRTVALKFVHPQLTRDGDSRHRLLHEARAASSVEHPNICTIHDIDGAENGHMFIVMAYYDGESLKVKIDSDHDGMAIEDAISTAIQIARGLARMHPMGIVHRDLKPANILINDLGEVKILDFGTAQLRGDPQFARADCNYGTVAYMSPEQCEEEATDGRTDIWSLGVILYETLTGQLPFQGETDQVVIYGIAHENPVPVSTLRPEIPAELEAIVSKAMVKQPDGRCQHVEDLLAPLYRVRSVWANGPSTNDRPSSNVLTANYRRYTNAVWLAFCRRLGFGDVRLFTD